MNTSKSSEGGEAATRILNYLEKLFGDDAEARARASLISSALDISAAFVRRTLSKWAIAGILRPVLVMDCTSCGSQSDEEPAERPQELTCEVCGSATLHEPIMLFAIGDRWNERHQVDGTSKKEGGRKLALRHLRPRLFLGVRNTYRSVTTV